MNASVDKKRRSHVRRLRWTRAKLFRLKSIEDIWMCLLVGLLNAYLIYNSYAKSRLVVSPGAAGPGLAFLVLLALECVLLLPVYLLTSFFEFGVNANANYKYGKDLDLENELESDEELTELDSRPSRCRPTARAAETSVPLLAGSEHDFEPARATRTSWASFWRFNMPPLSSLVHIILALAILYSNLLLSGNQIENGLTPKSYVFHNELDILFARPLERAHLLGSFERINRSLARINASSGGRLLNEEVIDVREINYEPKLSFELINLLIALVIFQLKYTKTLWHLNKLFSLFFLAHLIIVSVLVLFSFATYQVLYKYELYHASTLNDPASVDAATTTAVPWPPTKLIVRTTSTLPPAFHHGVYDRRGGAGRTSPTVRNNYLSPPSYRANQTRERSEKTRDLYNFESIYSGDQTRATRTPKRPRYDLPFLSSPRLTLPLGYLLTVAALLVSCVPVYMYAVHRYNELFEALKKRFLKFIYLNRLMGRPPRPSTGEKKASETAAMARQQQQSYYRFAGEDTDTVDTDNSTKTNLLIKNLTNELMKLNEDHFEAASSAPPPPLPSLPPPTQQQQQTAATTNDTLRMIESFMHKKSSDESDETCENSDSSHFKSSGGVGAQKVFSSSSPISSDDKNEAVVTAAAGKQATPNPTSSSPTSSICFENKKADAKPAFEGAAGVAGLDKEAASRAFKTRRLYSKLSSDDEVIYKDVKINFYDEFLSNLEAYRSHGGELESYYTPYKAHLVALGVLLFMCVSSSFVQVYDSVCLYQLTNDKLALLNAVFYVAFIVWYIFFWLVLTLTTTTTTTTTGTTSTPTSYSSLSPGDSASRQARSSSSRVMLVEPRKPTRSFYKFELSESFKMNMWFALNEFVKASSPARTLAAPGLSGRSLRELAESARAKAADEKKHYLNDQEQETDAGNRPQESSGRPGDLLRRGQSDQAPTTAAHGYDNANRARQATKRLSSASSMTNLSAILNSSDSNILERTSRLRIDVVNQEDRLYSRHFDKSSRPSGAAAACVGGHEVSASKAADWERVYQQAQSLININNHAVLRIDEPTTALSSGKTASQFGRPHGAYSSENLLGAGSGGGQQHLRDSQKLSPLMENFEQDQRKSLVSCTRLKIQEDVDTANSKANAYNQIRSQQVMLVKEKAGKKLPGDLDVQELLILKLDDVETSKKDGGCKEEDMMFGLGKDTAILAVASSSGSSSSGNNDSKTGMINSKVCNFLNKIAINDSSEVSIASSSSMSASITPPPSSSVKSDESKPVGGQQEPAKSGGGVKGSLDSYSSSNSKSALLDSGITNAECDSSSSNLEPSLNETNYRITLRQKAHEIYSLNPSQAAAHQRAGRNTAAGGGVELKIKSQSRNFSSENSGHLSTPSSTVGTVTTPPSSSSSSSSSSSTSSTSSTSSSPPTFPTGDMVDYFEPKSRNSATRKSAVEPDTGRFSSHFDKRAPSSGLGFCREAGTFTSKCTLSSGNSVIISQTMQKLQQQQQQQPEHQQQQQQQRMRPSFHQSTMNASLNPSRPANHLHIKKSTSFVNNSSLGGGGASYHHHQHQQAKPGRLGKATTSREPSQQQMVGSSSMINDDSSGVGEHQFSYLLRPFVLRSNRSHSSNMTSSGGEP